MRTMNIGRLNKRITIKKKVDSVNSLNQKSKTYQDVKTVWASIAPVRGAERYELQKLNEEITYRVYIRYISGIRADMYIAYKDKLFEIRSVIDVDLDGKMLEIDCVEKIVKTEG
jgi:SPP1 family predicted phage head-tail adaptor